MIAWLLLVASPLAGAAVHAAVPEYSLDECLRLALKQNPDILSANQRLIAARAAITVAKSAVYPALTTSAFYQKREQEVATNGNEFPQDRTDDYVLDARVTQNLYSAGGVRARIAIAKLRADAEALNHQASLVAVALQVRLAFYQTLFARDNIRVQQESVDLLRAQVKDQQNLLRAGSVGQINVNRAQVTLVNQLPALEQARSGLQAAYVSLSQLLAIPFSEQAVNLPFTIRGELSTVPIIPRLLPCLLRADAHRPEIASRQLGVYASQRQITVEKSATRPQVNAFAAYDVYSETDVRSVNDNFSGYTVGLAANWQIFDGFATRGRVRAAQAQVGIGEAGVMAIRQQVQAEVRGSYYDLLQASAMLQPQTENIRLANENLELTAKNMSAGIATQLELLQTRVDLTRAQSTELAGRLGCNTALARLRSAMGEADLPPGAPGSALPPLPTGK